MKSDKGIFIIFEGVVFMKKAIVPLLAISMLFSLVGCTPKEEPTKDLSTKRPRASTSELEDPRETTTQDTSESTTEHTHAESDPSQSEHDPSSSSKTSAAERNPTCPIELTFQDRNFVKSYDATLLSYTTDGIRKAYGATDSKDEMKAPDFVQLRADTIRITDPGYEKLQEAIDAILNPRLEKLNEEYDKAVADFFADEKAGKELHSKLIEERIRVFRADSEIFSFAILTAPIADDPTLCQTYNFHSKTGERIQLSDLITDKEVFKDYLRTQMVDQGYSLFSPVSVTLFETDRLPIAISYEGLVIPLGKLDIDSTNYFDDSENTMRFDYISVPVINNTEVFNMELFQKLPSSYSIFADHNHTMYWDFTGDGKMDLLVINVSTEKEADEEKTFMDIFFYPDTMTRSLTSFELEAEAYNHAYMIRNGEKWNLCIGIDSDASLYSHTLILTYNTDLSAVENDGGFVGYPDYDSSMHNVRPGSADPRHLSPSSFELLPGGFMCLQRSGSINDHGEFIADDEGEIYKGFACGVVTSAKIKGKKVDADGKELEEVSIPKGTPCALVETTGFEGDDLYVIFETLHTDASKNIRVKIPASRKDGKTYLNDTEIHELFDYILMGD